MLRLFGLLFLLMSSAALALDFRDSGDGLASASFAERWASIHLDSLIGLQSGLENRVHPTAFLDYVLPVLELPAAPTLAALGVVMLALSLILRRRRKA